MRPHLLRRQDPGHTSNGSSLAGDAIITTVPTSYPFEPKSISRLLPGQFWAVPLADGRFACGRVLAVPRADDPKPNRYLNNRIFVAGLMNWTGDHPPDSEAIADSELIAQGSMHVIGLTDSGSQILGRRALELDGISGLLELSHGGGGTVWLFRGGARLRPASDEEQRTLPIMSSWGRRYIVALANDLLLDP